MLLSIVHDEEEAAQGHSSLTAAKLLATCCCKARKAPTHTVPLAAGKNGKNVNTQYSLQENHVASACFSATSEKYPRGSTQCLHVFCCLCFFFYGDNPFTIQLLIAISYLESCVPYYDFWKYRHLTIYFHMDVCMHEDRVGAKLRCEHC